MSNKLKEFYCYSCDGTFKVKHDMDDRKYPILNCVFCGDELSDDEYSSDEWQDEDSDE